MLNKRYISKQVFNLDVGEEIKVFVGNLLAYQGKLYISTFAPESGKSVPDSETCVIKCVGKNEFECDLSLTGNEMISECYTKLVESTSYPGEFVLEKMKEFNLLPPIQFCYRFIPISKIVTKDSSLVDSLLSDINNKEK